MKRISIAVLLIFLAGSFASPVLAKTTFISIGTGGTGGIYYPYGGGVAEIWSKYVKGVKAVAEVTGASVENVKLAHKGETVIGEVMGDVAVAGFNGLSKFKGKKHDILSMAIMYPNLLQIVALKSTGVTDITQVKGRSISTGSPGSGTNFMAEAVFGPLGIGTGQLQRQPPLLHRKRQCPA
jgi:TRAP transporter TAXI family solute receptor